VAKIGPVKPVRKTMPFKAGKPVTAKPVRKSQPIRISNANKAKAEALMAKAQKDRWTKSKYNSELKKMASNKIQKVETMKKVAPKKVVSTKKPGMTNNGPRRSSI
jgi:hypothetical protein